MISDERFNIWSCHSLKLTRNNNCKSIKIVTTLRGRNIFLIFLRFLSTRFTASRSGRSRLDRCIILQNGCTSPRRSHHLALFQLQITRLLSRLPGLEEALILGWSVGSLLQLFALHNLQFFIRRLNRSSLVLELFEIPLFRSLGLDLLRLDSFVDIFCALLARASLANKSEAAAGRALRDILSVEALTWVITISESLFLGHNSLGWHLRLRLLARLFGLGPGVDLLWSIGFLAIRVGIAQAIRLFLTHTLCDRILFWRGTRKSPVFPYIHLF